MVNVKAIILAAGRGTRMRSVVPKALHELFGRPIISYVVDSVKGSGIKDIVAVAGYGAPDVRRVLGGVKTVVQKRLLGSGDAVKTAKAGLAGFKGDLLVICGDTPLISAGTIKELYAKHKASGARATVLTARLEDPSEYGRIERDPSGRLTGITEALEVSPGAAGPAEVNVGTYFFRAEDLFAVLARIGPNKRKGEYFLTDAIKMLSDDGMTVASASVRDAGEMIGINTRMDLAEAANTMKKTLMDGLMAAGVTIQDPLSTTIFPGAKIGKDSVIYPNTFIESDVEIGPFCRIGPFARLRPGVRIADHVEVGNFVELVRTKVGRGTKIKHHTYLGDTTVGKNVNVGAGTITANFDGKRKRKTIIGDNCFIGIGARLVAPVKIGRGAVLGAGCVVLKDKDVPPGATVVGVPARVLGKKSKTRSHGR
jgi:bifunctional UDP-N-acetylglucosamine pyrophosphorylase/glucosamine-1-phosphate N-acetyltransferase